MKDLSFDFTTLEATRNNILKIINTRTTEQLNKIPSSFNNNLIWNFGHVIITQQLLVYGLSKTPMYVSEEFVSKYRKGSKPEQVIQHEEIEELKELAHTTIKKLKEDIEKNIFGSYKTYTTSYGVTLNSVQDAISFNNSHEAMHLGTCLDLVKFV